MIRVLIKTSSPVVKAGIESLLRSYTQFHVIDEETGEIIGETADDDDSERSDDLLTSEEDSHADVILAEADAAHSGASIIDHASENTPVVLLVRDPAASWNDAVRRGARAVLPSNASAAQIAAAIGGVAAGLFVLDAEHAQQLLPARTSDHFAEPLVEAMTPREVEVLRAMAEGLANKEIAARLGISENTVKFHVGSVMGKLGASSRTEAVMLGIRRGLILL
ncbi:MAG TPA: response regulator transcription factor [Candidatus Acidoferrales bacterium]